ncbi:ABC transporter ATP-binding protein [Candidatus Formimonas warabiya]|uniref:ABC transporter ATP-binding protein n=1 Tax=Formimonas warabiya TaxID=1761012 RepID=A0A3G1KYL4_FORW1|nr:ABC transporter ATP-binding protein [Candidatus Formimonas warabiya]ATW27542.1 ABC transporter ATP-binding protein [Candidatus Formimonas warabiya]
MEEPLLKIENLSIRYPGEENQVPALDQVSFSLNRGESLGLIGESGSGKTSLALALMGVSNAQAKITGEIFFQGIDQQGLSEKEKNRCRWSGMAMVFQNSLDVLNPVLTIYEQIYECLRSHTVLPPQEAHKKVIRLVEMVGLDSRVQKCYPHQLSGGMRQRVLLAMALSCDPALLIVDEPTSALDAVAKNEIGELLARLHREKKFSLLVISHEMNIVSLLTSKVMVLYAGQVMEEGMTQDVIKNPLHNYTRGLIYSSPALNPFRDLWGIPGEKEEDRGSGCPFFPRCSQRVSECRMRRPPLAYVSIERRVACNRGGIVTLLEGKNLSKVYRLKGREVAACQKCDLDIRAGEVAVLIGESGSGKTTLAGILAGSLCPDSGEVVFEGGKVQGNQVTRQKRGIQIIFQDPFSAVNEHFTVEQAVQEPLVIRKQEGKPGRRELTLKALTDVQLPCDDGFLKRRIHTLSGGQRQRVAIARSLVMEPKLLIADEISSMLDPSTQANILRLLKGLQNRQGFAMLYVTHDLALARKIADMVYVMHQGRIIEKGAPAQIFHRPSEDYTQKLINGSPISHLF